MLAPRILGSATLVSTLYYEQLWHTWRPFIDELKSVPLIGKAPKLPKSLVIAEVDINVKKIYIFSILIIRGIPRL